MEEKKRKDDGKKESRPLNYEDILDGFATGDEPKEETANTRGDLDGLALAELLGDEDEPPVSDTMSGSFDTIGAEDYSSLARQFEELDLSDFAEEDGEDKQPGESAGNAVTGEFPVLDTLQDEETAPDAEEEASYSAILENLEDTPGDADRSGEEEPEFRSLEELDLPEAAISDDMESGETDLMQLPDLDDLEPAEPSPMPFDAIEAEIEIDEERSGPEARDRETVARGLLGIVNLADDTLPVNEIPEADEVEFVSPADSAPRNAPKSEAVAEMDSGADDEDGVFSLNDLFDEVDGRYDEESVRTMAPPPARDDSAGTPAAGMTPGNEEHDFLGLSGTAAASGPTRRVDASMETLFDGVEMRFSEQTDLVTMGELLLAQGKDREAAECFRKVAQKKGVTNWVAKRLRMLSTNIEK